MIGDQITAFDLVLAPGIVALVAVLLHIRDIFASIVLFIIFSLLMAVAWVRLDAIDIALAEAAIGAGITGALLLNALGDVAVRGAGECEDVAPWRSVLAGILVAPVVLILAHAVASAPAELDAMRPAIEASMTGTGVEHDVTAVLMSFRAYDTLLELSVLFLAVIGAWALHLRPARRRLPPMGVVLAAAARALVPTAVLIAGYLLWRGTQAPGGAFQAGAVLAGAAVLIHLAARSEWPGVLEPVVAPGLSLGLFLFGTVGLVATIVGKPFLFYRGTWAEILIPTVEIAAMVSIALALVGIFSGRPHWLPEEDP